MSPDTIVALATPRGAAARAVIRVSGPRALAAVDPFFVPASGQPPVATAPRGVLRGTLVLGATGEVVDVRLLVFRGPKSFTGEDVVEIHLPGSPILADVVQDLLHRHGARPATPGEFTRRAFFAGRIDLTRAEAVLALTRAHDQEERRQALALLEGGLERRIAVLRDRILQALVPLELELDFSDQDLEITDPVAAGEALAAAEADLAALLAGPLRPGGRHAAFRVVLSGPVNAGKSSLFNRLVGREAAIVSGIPGTTRDVLVGETEEDGLRIQLVDTAGDDVLGSEADRQAFALRARRLRAADLVLEVRDARREAAAPPETRHDRLRVLTHADLLPGPRPAAAGEVVVSTWTGSGLPLLRQAIADRLRSPALAPATVPVLVNHRHAAALRNAQVLLARARAGLAGRLGGELVAADLRAVLAAFSEITGEDAPQAVLDRIFASFCIGK